MRLRLQQLALVAAGFTFWIGFLVNVGWLFHIQTLFQIIPDTTPMQFNAALCFMMAGTGLVMAMSQIRGRTRIVQFCSIWLITWGFLTVCEYVFGISLGIDQLLFKSYFTLGTTFPGRMAPNSAFCFFLAGVNILLIRFRSRNQLGIFTALLFATLIGSLGLSSLAGYIFSFDPSYGWGNFSRMAPHTSMAFVLISISQIAWVVRLDRRTFSKRKRYSPIFGALGVMFLTLLLWQASLQQERQRVTEQVELQSRAFSQQFKSTILERTKGLERMASRWTASERTPLKLWTLDAKKYIEDLKGLLVVGWADRDSVVRALEPSEKYKDVLGYKLSNEANRSEAVKRVQESGKATITKSLKLIHGGQGFIVLVPTYYKGKYDGFIYGVFPYDLFFSQVFKFDGFYAKVTEGANTIFTTEGPNQELTKRDWSTTTSIDFSDVQWRLELIPNEETVRAKTTYLPLMVLIFGSLFAFLVGLLIDLLQHSKYSQEVLRLAYKKAETATVAKSQFLANMSHEIRTPLNGVLGMTQLLRETELNTEQSSYVDTIKLSADTLLSVINDVLDFSKIEAGKMELEEIDFNLEQAIHEVKRTLVFSANQKGLQIETEVLGSIPPFVKGDPSRLKQILINFVSNSIKFTPRGKIVIRVRFSLPESRIEVIDTGVGIPADRIQYLFQSFTQVDATTTRRFGGTGLGLSISKKLVEMMGGKVGVESTEGIGSTFWFTMNLKESSRQVEQPKFETFKKVHNPFKGSRILLAEDNIVNQKIAIKMIEHMGFKVQAVANGLEVLNALRSMNYDLILMDCQMPELDGYETTREIRRSKTILANEIPIVAMTANAVQGDREKCLAAGMNDYISKPIDANRLEACIVKVLLQAEKAQKRA